MRMTQNVVTMCITPRRRDNILREMTLIKRMLQLSSLLHASLAQGSPHEDVQTAMLTSTSHLTSSDDKVQKLQDSRMLCRV